MVVVPLPTGTYEVGAVWGPAAAISPPDYPGGLWGGHTLTFDGAGGLTGITNVGFTFTATGALAEFGADGIVAWGRWGSGQTTIAGSDPSVLCLDYIAAVQSPSTSVLHASYSVFTSTAVTAVSGTTLTVGTSNQITGTVTVSGSTVTSSTGACTGGCAGNVTNAGLAQGWFYGPAGERVGLNFGFSSDLGNVSAAVVLK